MALSDAIWAVPELHFQEKKSMLYMKEALEKEGFQTEVGVAGLETALVGTYGSGKPVIAFLGEYDALPGLSQKVGQHNMSLLWMVEAVMAVVITY